MITCDLCKKPVDQTYYLKIDVSIVTGAVKKFTWEFHVCKECGNDDFKMVLLTNTNHEEYEFEDR